METVSEVPNLRQCVVTGAYYARCKAKGKPVRASIETATGAFTTAKRDCRQTQRITRAIAAAGRFVEGSIVKRFRSPVLKSQWQFHGTESR
jgi:hypothetical protein